MANTKAKAKVHAKAEDTIKNTVKAKVQPKFKAKRRAKPFAPVLVSLESDNTSPSRSASPPDITLSHGNTATALPSPATKHDPEQEGNPDTEDDAWPADPTSLIPQLSYEELIIPRLRVQAVRRAADVVLKYQDKYLQVSFDLDDISRADIEEAVGYDKVEAILGFSRAQHRSMMSVRWEDVANLDPSDGISYLYVRNRLEEACANVRKLAEKISTFEAVLQDVMAADESLTVALAKKKARVMCYLEEDDDDDEF